MTRVLILWADRRSANLGVRVLAEGAVALARQVWGSDASCTCQDFAGSETGVSFGPRAAVKGLLSSRSELATFVRQFDVVLDTGAGDSFTDIYGMKRFSNMALVQKRVTTEKIPLVFTPQTIGPFNTVPGRLLARHVMRHASTIAVRDHESGNAAASLGRGADVVSSDMVFFLDRPPAGEESARVGLLNVSGLLWNENDHVDWRQYRRNVATARAAIERAGLEVVLFPHVLDSPFADNDVRIIADVQTFLGGDLEAWVPEDLSAARRMVAGAGLVIGARMHACLNALSLGVPAIPMAYSRKFAPLLSDIGWGHVVGAGSVEAESFFARPAPLDLELLRSDALHSRSRGTGRAQQVAAHLKNVAGPS